MYSAMILPLFGGHGRRCRIAPPFRFANLHQIELGHDVNLMRDCWIHVLGGLGDDVSIKLKIGNRCGIGMQATIAAAQSVVLEDQVLLARNVYIADHAHAFTDVSIPIMDQGIGNIAPVRIGRNTWLGQNVAVLPGVTIGEHCIVGANSVVNHSIPSFSVAVGAPARVVRTYNPATKQWQRLSPTSGDHRAAPCVS
jgi:lipopolysaccharide O-acetyltransferase